MQENNFKELLEKAVEVKKSDTTGLASAVIIASACGFVLSTIIGSCSGSSQAEKPASKN